MFLKTSVIFSFKIVSTAIYDLKNISYLHPQKSSGIFLNDKMIGVLGEAHPEVLSSYEISERAYLFEINFEEFTRYAKDVKRFQPLPKFPAVYRDLSLVADQNLEVGTIIETISSLNQKYIHDISLFDIYQGPPIPQGKKGVSLRFKYQAQDRTLTDEEVNRYHEAVIGKLMEDFKVELRK